MAVRHFMARFPSLPPLPRVAPGVRAVTVRLPAGSRFEYRLLVTTDGSTVDIADPTNPRRATNPFGENSVAFGPGYVEPWWALPGSGPKGTLLRGFVDSDAFGERRYLRWYHPPTLVRKHPLVVVHDGGDFVDHASFVTVLDNLIGVGAIPPVVAVFIDPGDRHVEYTDDPRHAEFVREVIGVGTRRRGVIADPARHVLIGASLGAVAALSAAWHHGTVGGLVLLSGSFVTALGGPTNRGRVFVPVIDFMHRFTAQPGFPAHRIYQACGAFEGLAPDNEAFTPVLRSTGADVLAGLQPDGHHWHNWRDRLGEALTHTVAGGDPSVLGTVNP